MKVVVLCGGKNRFRGYGSSKPRHLYHVNGKAQILRVIAPFRQQGIPIKDFRFVVSDKKPFLKFFQENGLIGAEFVENKHPYKSAVYSLKEGLKSLEDQNQPIIITQDEILESQAIKDIIAQTAELVCFKKGSNAPDTAVIKIYPGFINFFTDDMYLTPDFYLKEKEMYFTYFSQRNEVMPDKFPFRIESGSALVFILIHTILRIEKTFPEKCFFCNSSLHYIDDLDKIYQTDEFKSVKKYGKDLGKILFFLKQNFKNISNIIKIKK